MRLDQRVVELALAPTRTKAQRLIEAGEVLVDGRVITRVSFAVQETHQITRGPGDTLKYVSRGGLKLEGALDKFGLDVRGFRCLDVGLSTGGFSDCLLRRGAAAIFGLDVGHGQLDPKLQNEPRLEAHAGVHVRELPAHVEAQAFIGQGLDLSVVDVSFISLVQVWPHLPRKGVWLILFKPQFEVGRDQINKSGIVKDPAVGGASASAFAESLRAEGFGVEGPIPSPLAGQDGNQEYFVLVNP